MAQLMLRHIPYQIYKLHLQENQEAVERRILETPELAELQVRRVR